MFNVRKPLLLALSLASGCLMAGCGGGGGGSGILGPAAGDARLEIHMTDAPVEGLESVIVTLAAIEVHYTGGPFVELTPDPDTIDLLELQDKVLPIASADLEAGKITQIRFVVLEGEVVVDGETYPLEIPSGTVKIVGPFDLPAGALAVLLVDFDAEESLHVVKAGNQDRYILRPVINKVSYDVKTEEDCADVVSSNPADGATDVDLGTTVDITFPAGTVLPADGSGLLDVSDDGGVPVTGMTTVVDTTATFTPDAPLMPETTYTVTVHRSAIEGQEFCPDVQFSFTTGL